MNKTILTNGHIIDPGLCMDGKYDIVLEDGHITGLIPAGHDYKWEAGADVLDAEGCYISPGWIDLHVHVFSEKAKISIEADSIGVQQGVTTIVDAGSSGVTDFGTFKETVINPSITEVLAWVNISCDGLCQGLSELADLSRLAPEQTVQLIRDEPAAIGIKARMSASVVKNNGIYPLEVAVSAADLAGVPVMVHIGNAPPELGEVLERLRDGDVVTHAFHGKKGGMLNGEGRILPEAEEALRRGVLLDLGHGTSSFSFESLARYKELGLQPFTISTDLYSTNRGGPVYSLAVTMNKVLTLGYSLEEVIRAVTTAPAKILRREHDLGTLREGSIADLTVFRLHPEEEKLIDSEKVERTARQKLTPLWTIKEGNVIACNQPTH
jgi:dihydroorotase